MFERVKRLLYNEVMGAPHQLCRTKTSERLTMENQVVGRSAEMSVSVLSDDSDQAQIGEVVGRVWGVGVGG